MQTIMSVAGRLGTNVELRKTNSQMDYATFRLATNQRLMRDGQWVDGPTSWITVKSFRQLATNIAMSLHKGQAVLVVGRLEVEEWVTNEGVQRESAVLYASAIGHDLNWGVSTLHRLERQRIEPVEAPEPDPDYDLPDQPGPAEIADEQVDLSSDESFAAGLGVPVG